MMDVGEIADLNAELDKLWKVIPDMYWDEVSKIVEINLDLEKECNT